MNIRPKLWTFFLISLFVLSQKSVFALVDEEEKVNFVEVQLNVSDKIYEGLQERIEFSITRVGEKILLSQPVSLLKANKEAVKNVIINVFSKVLVGFKVESVDLFPGEHTKIIIHLTPIPPLIANIQLHLETSDIHPELNGLTREITQKIEDELNPILVGLPVASVSWSDGIIKLVVNYLMGRDFPGFTSRFSLEPGVNTKINLSLTPQEPVVSSVTVDYTTTNFPAWLVRAKTKQYQEKVKILKGIPMDFLIHYQPYIEKHLSEYLNDFSELQNLGLQVKLGITPGVTTQVRLHADSQVVQGYLEGRYFVSNEQNYSNILAYLGYRSSGYELYSKYYFGENPSGNWKVGLGFPIEQNLTGGLEYEFDHSYRQAWFHYQFERGDYLDLKLGIDNSPNEAVIGIFINDYVDLEIAHLTGIFGLQAMFHF